MNKKNLVIQNQNLFLKMIVLKNILIRNWFGLLIAVICLSVAFQQCENVTRNSNNVLALKGQIISYQNALGTTTSQIKTLELDKQQLEDDILEKNDTIAKLVKKFSNVQSIVKTKTITQFDTIKIPFSSQTPCAFVREGSKIQRWYSLKYKVDSTGIEIDSLKIPTTQIVVIGLQRKWWLGKETLITEVTNTNPNIKTTSLESIKTVVSKKWYDSFLFKFSLGLGAGILIAK